MDTDNVPVAIADHEVIAQWYRAKAHDLRRLAWRRLRDWDAAEEVVQETFARALAQPALRCDDPLWPWLATVAHRLCLDRIEQGKRRPTVTLDAVAEMEATTGDPVVEIERRAETEMMAEALATLTPTHRRVLHQAHLEDQSYAVIAALEARSVPWVKTVVMRARQRLRLEMERLRGGAAGILLWPLLLMRRLRAPGLGGQVSGGVQVGLAAAMVAGTVALTGGPHHPGRPMALAPSAIASAPAPDTGGEADPVTALDEAVLSESVVEDAPPGDEGRAGDEGPAESEVTIEAAAAEIGEAWVARRSQQPAWVPAVTAPVPAEDQPDLVPAAVVPEPGPDPLPGAVGEPPAVEKVDLAAARDLVAAVTW